MVFNRHPLLTILTVSLFAGCGSTNSDATPPYLPDTGSVSLALRSEVGTRTFELRDAVFSITGAAELELLANDAPEALFIEETLPVGDYSVELESGWSLVEFRDAEAAATSASLVSQNPQSFEIVDGVRTELGFRFELEADAEEVALGSGTLSLGIEIAQHQEGTVVFSELMANPAELADGDGEWFELLNVSDTEVSLEGCVLERDGGAAFTIAAALALAPGAMAALAVSAAPGFAPEYVYSGLALANSGIYTLGLRCGNAVLDTVTVDASVWPLGPGLAASLDPDATTASGNDSPAAWCGATTTYNTDLGSPGAANPACG